MTRAFVFISLTIFGLVLPCYGQHTLTVVVSEASPGVGQALGSLFDSEDTYLKAPSDEMIVEIDDEGLATLTFKGLSAGTYAVSVIYDRNSDGELNTNFLGIPKELIAMSNNAKGRFGPPSFEKTRFDVLADTTIEIRFAKVKD